MWPFSSCDQADACEAVDPNAITVSSIVALVPFAGVFLATNALVVRHIFPRLNYSARHLDGDDHYLPSHAPPALAQAHAEHGAKSLTQRGVMWTFGTTVGLAATLGSIILAEILGVVNPSSTVLALRLTVPTLLFLLAILVPWLECRSFVRGAGWSFQRTATGRIPRAAWGLHTLLFIGWLLVFWSLGRATSSSESISVGPSRERRSWIEALTEACLERVVVAGLSLMGLLAGFASVSSPWQTFGEVPSLRRRPVTEADVKRKESGLEATSETLLTKRHRLQVLERRGAELQGTKGSGTFLGKMVNSIRGPSGEEVEMRSLRMEIAGLETMEATLASNLALLKGRRAATVRAATPIGRLLLVPSYVFSCYCVYRILATTLTTVRRTYSPSASFANSDPVNRFLGLLAKHWDPTLDQMAWARTISFALSGVILLASFNSVLQTFYLFAKWAPSVLRHVQANLALAVGQVSATYVISASLLMRSQLPAEVRMAVGRGPLKSGLSPAWTDSWFEGWFLLGSCLTGLGIWIGRTVSRGGWEDEVDEFGMEEMGAKRS